MEGEYCGFQTVSLTADELGVFYSSINDNAMGCLQNEYLIINSKETGELIEAYRWDGSRMVRVPFKAIKSRYFGSVKPRNIHQQLAVDMLYNSDITVKVLTGCYGSGKFFAPLRSNAH